ncbi:MAG: hypothetical protein KGN33_17315 [Paracoccaceae bacterium]|nr:hypothetical protein [Paracoccaceae bacterium]
MQVEIEQKNGEKTTVFLTEPRVIWALEHLIRAGKRGITTLENPAPRWSAYLHKIKRAGIPFTKVTEKHGGDFEGWHARFFIGEGVRIVRRVVE